MHILNILLYHMQVKCGGIAANKGAMPAGEMETKEVKEFNLS